ncbi:MAG: SMC-Scp complex subunit ScpB [Anaerolineae bacterium]|nr:SMC-Scp complex subunit ScpB [Anaerolineae bacterium]
MGVNENLSLEPEALIEALIFAAERPISVTQLAEVTGLTSREVEELIANLETRMSSSGLRIQHNRGRLQMVSAPEAGPYVETMLGLEVNLRFSQAAMETLAIIAYAQPVTRPQIDAIRGVNSDSTLRTLLSAGLIEDAGRAETLGRPILYRTTFEFLQQFGLKSAEDLPPLEPEKNIKPAADITGDGDVSG